MIVLITTLPYSAVSDTLRVIQIVSQQQNGNLWLNILQTIGIVCTIGVVLSAIKSLNESYRPYITVNLEAGDIAYRINLVIRNTGNRGAHNVVIKSSPSLDSTVLKDYNSARSIIDKPIPDAFEKKAFIESILDVLTRINTVLWVIISPMFR